MSNLNYNPEDCKWFNKILNKKYKNYNYECINKNNKCLNFDNLKLFNINNVDFKYTNFYKFEILNTIVKYDLYYIDYIEDKRFKLDIYESNNLEYVEDYYGLIVKNEIANYFNLNLKKMQDHFRGYNNIQITINNYLEKYMNNIFKDLKNEYDTMHFIINNKLVCVTLMYDFDSIYKSLDFQVIYESKLSENYKLSNRINILALLDTYNKKNIIDYLWHL